MDKSIKNLEASIKSRLLNYARDNGKNYNTILTLFSQERFLARLSISKYRNHFILKGGLLLLAGHISDFRPTGDIDILGTDITNDSQRIKTIIKEIAEIQLSDNIIFNTKKIQVQVIKEDNEYEGLRYIFWAFLGKTRSPIKIDIGFGDTVPDGFKEKELPTLLTGFKAPELLVYPLESVIAEKLEAIVYLGNTNSRMKDFYDIHFLAGNNRFLSLSLKKAITATFQTRGTEIENRIFIYQDEYIDMKSNLWKTFLRKIKSPEINELSEIILKIKAFIEPLLVENVIDGIWDPQKWEWSNNK